MRNKLHNNPHECNTDPFPQIIAQDTIQGIWERIPGIWESKGGKDRLAHVPSGCKPYKGKARNSLGLATENPKIRMANRVGKNRKHIHEQYFNNS